MSTDRSKDIEQVNTPETGVAEVAQHSEGQPAAEPHVVHEPEHEFVQPLPRPPAPGEDLHVCRHCYGELVYPVDWAEAGPSHWEVSLRCPDCEWGDTGIFAQTAVERFDIELDRGAEVLLRDLQHLAHANMAEFVERFAGALRADHIVPADF